MNNRHGGVIWTNHALERLDERQISQSDALATFKKPDSSRYASSKNAYVYYRSFGDTTIEVVAKKNERGEWLILSVWSRSTENHKYALKKRAPQGFWGFLKQHLFGR